MICLGAEDNALLRFQPPFVLSRNIMEAQMNVQELRCHYCKETETFSGLPIPFLTYKCKHIIQNPNISNIYL